jgi:hypothetical protein
MFRLTEIAMVDLTRPCDACGNFIGGGYYHCPKCKIHFCFYCAMQLLFFQNSMTVTLFCPMCDQKMQ